MSCSLGQMPQEEKDALKSMHIIKYYPKHSELDLSPHKVGVTPSLLNTVEPVRESLLRTSVRAEVIE
jgi:hypothetical protein